MTNEMKEIKSLLNLLAQLESMVDTLNYNSKVKLKVLDNPIAIEILERCNTLGKSIKYKKKFSVKSKKAYTLLEDFEYYCYLVENNLPTTVKEIEDFEKQ